MPRRVGVILLIAACSPLLLSAGRAGGTTPTCAKLKETSLHWDAVFAHVSSVSEANVLRARIAHYGFKQVVYEKDWCDDVEVMVAGLDRPQQRQAFAQEASAVGFDVSFEPPYTLRKMARGYVKAIFGTLPTLNRANTLQRNLAKNGFREGTDIERLDAQNWRVVLYRIPSKVRASFGAEARKAGFTVKFEH